MGSQEYSDYLNSLKKSSGSAPALPELPKMPMTGQGQGRMSNLAGGELENIDIRLKDMERTASTCRCFRGGISVALNLKCRTV